MSRACATALEDIWIFTLVGSPGRARLVRWCSQLGFSPQTPVFCLNWFNRPKQCGGPAVGQDVDNEGIREAYDTPKCLR